MITNRFFPRACCGKGGARRRTPAEKEPMQPVRSDCCGASSQGRRRQSQTRARVGVLGPSLRGGSEIWGWVLPGRRPFEGAPERIPCPSKWRRSRDRSAASARAASRRPSSGPHAGRRGQPDAGCPEEVNVPRLRGSGTRSRPSLRGAGLLLRPAAKVSFRGVLKGRLCPLSGPARSDEGVSEAFPGCC